MRPTRVSEEIFISLVFMLLAQGRGEDRTHLPIIICKLKGKYPQLDKNYSNKEGNMKMGEGECLVDMWSVCM